MSRVSKIMFVCLVCSTTLGLTTASIRPAQTSQEVLPDHKRPGNATEPLQVEDLFRRSIVVDGTVNYYSTITGSGIGQPDFDRDNRQHNVKQATGIDIGGITVSTFASLERETAHLQTGRYQGAMMIRRAADIDTAIREKKYGIIFYAQKHYPLNGSVDNIKHWFAAGLRIVQLQYSATDENQGASERLGGGPGQPGGLTKLGRKVVHELIRLGMVVDLAHCNTQTTIDTAEIARKFNVPITANHVGARNIKTHNGHWMARYVRNATDEKLIAVKSTNGVVGVIGFGPYLRGPYQELRVKRSPEDVPRATVDDYVAHVDYMVKLIGVDHVGLCTDGYLDGTMAYGREADGVLDSPQRWKAVIQRLHQLGYSEAALQKIMGLNFLRVYRRVFK